MAYDSRGVFLAEHATKAAHHQNITTVRADREILINFHREALSHVDPDSPLTIVDPREAALVILFEKDKRFRRVGGGVPFSSPTALHTPLDDATRLQTSQYMIAQQYGQFGIIEIPLGDWRDEKTFNTAAMRGILELAEIAPLRGRVPGGPKGRAARALIALAHNEPRRILKAHRHK